MIYIGLFLLGACWESFIQVVIDRVPLGMSFVKGRSCCNVCYHQLSFFDMFPVMNWIFLKGRCRFCQQRIPVKYPISEFIGGLLLIICFEIYGLSGYMFTIYFVGSILYAMSVIDFQTLLVYDNCLVMLLIFVIFSLPFMYVPFLERIIGCIGVSGLMMMTNFLSS